MNVPSFGDKIKVVASLERYREAGGIRTWHRNVYAEPKEAVFVIKRTFANGKVTVDNYGEEGVDRYFEATEHLPGAIAGIKGIGVEKVLLSDIINVCQTCGEEKK